MHTELITLDGHIIDSLTLSKVLDMLITSGVDYEIREFRIGKSHDEPSHAEILVIAPDEESLQRALHEVQQHGAVISQEDADLQPAPQDGVFPEGFYSTTNLETFVRLEGTWIPVERIEMDCGIRVIRTETGWRAECAPLHWARKGDLFVVGNKGVRVTPLPRREAESVFHFMGSEVSIEKPKTRIVQAVARAVREAKARGQKVLFVGGPAIVHTGAAPYLERIIRSGWVDVLFAGNALATHDIERVLYGTSLGVALETGAPET
ncbi:MAG: TIGR00300 family protein, partial [bacterium]|nr:TIGR00300 family protein [bacterium]